MSNIIKFKGVQLPSTGLDDSDRAAMLRAKDMVGGSNSGIQYLKLDIDSHDWVYGRESTQVEDGSEWAVNPKSFVMGYIAWTNAGPKKIMRSIKEPEVRESDLYDLGRDKDGNPIEWKLNVGFQLQCVYGADKDTVLEYTITSDGGKKAWSDLITAIYAQRETDPVNVVPVIELLVDSYQHSNPAFKRVYKPVFKIKKWMAYDGSEAPPAEPPAQEQEPERKVAEPKTAPPGAASNGAQPERRRAAAAVTDVEAETVEASKPASGPAEPVQRRRRRAAAS